MATTGKKQRELRDVVIDLVESLHLDERYPADDVAEKIEAVLEKALDEAGIPDPDDFIGWDDQDALMRDWELVGQDDLKDFLNKEDVEEFATAEELGEYVKNDELEDALEQLEVVTHSDLMYQVSKRGFFGRLKWLFTGR